MADKIIRNYKLSASGLLSVDENGQIYISVADGPQDVNLAGLLMDFNGRQVKLSCAFDDEYVQNVNESTGEII